VSDFSTPGIEWLAVIPTLAVAGAGVVIVMGRALAKRAPGVHAASVFTAFVGVVGALVFTVYQWLQVQDDGGYVTFGRMVALDGFAVYLSIVVLIATLLALLVSAGYVTRVGLEGPEYLALLLFSSAGLLVMATANDLIVVFIALEVLSIPLYVLAAIDPRRAESQEAGIKYFLIGAFSSAIFLYGVALTFGAVGSTNLTTISEFLAGRSLLDHGVLLAAIGLLIVGVAFKSASVPFHMWAPDVYDGAPSPVTGFMAAAVKAGAFAAFLRVIVGAFSLQRNDWRGIVWVLAVLSMLVGSIAALTQTDIKRMLAYSSISHVGYVLIGVYTATTDSVAAALLYLLAYTFMVSGAFAVITLVSGPEDRSYSLDDYKGLGRREPFLAGVLTLMLLAMAGVPLTAGFVAKLDIFAAAVDAEDYSLAIVGVIAAVIAAFIYLRVVVSMYMDGEEPHDEAPDAAPAGSVKLGTRIRVDVGTGIALAICVVAVLAIGILPNEFWEFSKDATLYFPLPAP